jgi:hypothetical protein
MAAVSMYHVAPASARDEIKRFGISVDALGERNHPWSLRGVYLFNNADHAIIWANSELRGYSALADIWECQVDTDEVMVDEYREVSGKYNCSWMVHEIDPECMKLVSIVVE